jgi:excisionase family DNA binding protein
VNTEQPEVSANDPFAGLPLLIPVTQAAKLIGISRAAAYRFASTGELPTKKLGRRVYVVSAKLRDFIESEGKAA